MVFPKARLVVSGLLFVGWILFLLYLVTITRDPVILSRPQILVANLCVLAKIDERDGRPAPEVRVTKILWSADDAQALAGKLLPLADVADLDRPQGWAGAGDYLLALTKRRSGKEISYELTAIPQMGFHPATVAVELVDVGPHRDQVAAHLQQALAVDAKQADALTRAPGLLKLYLAREAADQLKKDLERLKAVVILPPRETRIYRATEDALQQFHELKPAE